MGKYHVILDWAKIFLDLTLQYRQQKNRQIGLYQNEKLHMTKEAVKMKRPPTVLGKAIRQ
jgi:hypothetical protein